jgi:hypothetical protein
MNFLIGIEYEPVSGSYMACFADGQNILLGATTYQDAVLEADMIDLDLYELG